MKRTNLAIVPILVGMALAGPIHAQTTEAQRAAVVMAASYRVVPNVVYQVASGYEAKLDSLPFTRYTKPGVLAHAAAWRLLAAVSTTGSNSWDMWATRHG